MSSACTCHINKERCLPCNKNVYKLKNGSIIVINDEIEFEKLPDKMLGIGLPAGCSGSDLSLQQIKELMLFLEENYGYLLEGVK